MKHWYPPLCALSPPLPVRVSEIQNGPRPVPCLMPHLSWTFAWHDHHSPWCIAQPERGSNTSWSPWMRINHFQTCRLGYELFLREQFSSRFLRVSAHVRPRTKDLSSVLRCKSLWVQSVSKGHRQFPGNGLKLEARAESERSSLQHLVGF